MQRGTSPELSQVLRSSTSFDIFGIITMYYNFDIIVIIPPPQSGSCKGFATSLHGTSCPRPLLSPIYRLEQMLGPKRGRVGSAGDPPPPPHLSLTSTNPVARQRDGDGSGAAIQLVLPIRLF